MSQELAFEEDAAAVIGGASLFGGYANILSSLMGALTAWQLCKMG